MHATFCLHGTEKWWAEITLTPSAVRGISLLHGFLIFLEEKVVTFPQQTAA
jgi:hypothetical protein